MGRWGAIVLLGTAVLGGSFLFLTQSTPTVVAATVAPAQARTVPSYIARIETIPAGSISAIAPLPQHPVELATVATTETVQPTQIVASPPADLWEVNTAVNVRSDPSKHGARLGALPEREHVRVLDEQRGWVLVVADDGLRGWVYSKFLTKRSETVAAVD
jgi:hypothetical protein